MAQTEGYMPRLCKRHLVLLLMFNLDQLLTSGDNNLAWVLPIHCSLGFIYCTRFDDFDPRRFKLRDFLGFHSSELYTTELVISAGVKPIVFFPRLAFQIS